MRGLLTALLLVYGGGVSAQTMRSTGSSGSGGAIAPSNISITVSDGGNATAITVNQQDVTNNKSGLIVTSTGTGNGIKIIGQGLPSGGYQNLTGGHFLITNLTNIATSLVIVDSGTNNQVGAGVFEIWEEATSHNDPLVWIHRKGSNSSPELRVDSPSPNMEVVNVSTANSEGLGKWEPWAMAGSGGINLQVNSRAQNNSTFENFWDMTPISRGGGLHLYPIVNGANGNTQSDNTNYIDFYTTSTDHTVGLRGPQATSASWTWMLPSTLGTTGGMWYQISSSGNRQLGIATDFLYNTATGVTLSTMVVTSSFTVKGVVTSSTPIPTITCDAGTGVVQANATSNHGRFTAGAAATTCTLTFAANNTFPKAPDCVCGDDTSIVAVKWASTATSVTCSAVTLSNDVVSYLCFGAP